MITDNEKAIMNCTDTYTMLYGCLVRSILSELGAEAERAVRLATRQYGYDRAEVSRRLHLENNLKINMLNLFTKFDDLPGDPRFKRELQELNPQERVSHTLVCSMADTWKYYGVQSIGRMYCEEFHCACYSHFAFDLTAVNLGKTLTQEGDDYCAFNVVLRPENVPDELKPLCFEEYDPDYVQPEVDTPAPEAKPGFSLLGMKLYFYLQDAVWDQFGEQGCAAVEKGLQDYARVTADIVRRRAKEFGDQVDRDYAEKNSLFGFSVLGDVRWELYSRNNAQSRFETHYCRNLGQAFGF